MKGLIVTMPGGGKIRRIQFIKPGHPFLEMNTGPPLGPLSLAATVRQRHGDAIEMEVVQQVVEGLDASALEKRMHDFQADLIGLSVMSVDAREMHQAAAMARRALPDAVIIVGGPHVSVFFDKVLEDANIDYAVLGEGEETLLEFIDRHDRGASMEGMLGLAYRGEDGRPVFAGPRPNIQDLDALPMVAWDLIDLQAYRKILPMHLYSKGFPYAFLFTSRGCPYRCAYCHDILGKTIRLRSPEKVLEEIDYLVKTKGVRELMIVDDCFNFNLDHAKRICDLIVERGIDVSISFPNGLRADRMDHELIRKLKAAGCYAVTYAIESGSPRIQKLIRKNLNLDKASEVIKMTDREGIITQAFFMLGFPGETLQEIEETVQFALRHPLLGAWFFTVVVYPRMGLTELARQEYPDHKVDWERKDFNYFSHVTLYELATGVNLPKVVRRAGLRFYSRPWVYYRTVWRMPWNRSFLKAHWHALKIYYIALWREIADFFRGRKLPPPGPTVPMTFNRVRTVNSCKDRSED